MPLPHLNAARVVHQSEHTGGRKQQQPAAMLPTAELAIVSEAAIHATGGRRARKGLSAPCISVLALAQGAPMHVKS